MKKQNNTKNANLLAAERTARLERRFSYLRTTIAIALALAISFLIIIMVSEDPWYSIKTFITGPFTSVRRMGNVFEEMIPLIFTGLGAAVMFQAQQFSLIGDGAFYLGSLIATTVTLYTMLPSGVHPLLAILVGTIVGGICGFIPGYLKAKWNINEFVTSTMLNYILVLFGVYFLLNFVRDPNSGFIATYEVPKTARLPYLVDGTKVHAGLIIALLATVLVYLFLYKTSWGFHIRMTGSNRRFADNCGINTFAVIILCQVIGGALAGMGGTVEVLGMYDRFQWQDTPGYGFDGMTVAILARNNPAMVPIASLFLAYLRTGTEIMARESDVPYEAVYIVQGIVMLLVTASALLSSLRHRMIVKDSHASAKNQEVSE